MIFTLDARDNVRWAVQKTALKLNSVEVKKMIESEFNTTKNMLKSKNIDYTSLKRVLIPGFKENKHETVFCIDASKIDNSLYGGVVFNVLLPHINKGRSHSILHGDFLMDDRQIASNILQNHLNIVHFNTFITAGDYYMVYISNLTETEEEILINALQQFEWFIGFGDMTYSNDLKDYLAYTIGQACLQYKDAVIMAHEDDRSYEENVNITWLPFKENGFSVLSFPECYYDSFLHYKLESRFLDKSDLMFSLNFLSEDPINYASFEIIVDEKKFEYVKNKNINAVKKTGIDKINLKEFSSKLKEELQHSYIYNLEINDYNIAKFNTNIELDELESERKIKMLASFEYNTTNRKLRLINLF